MSSPFSILENGTILFSTHAVETQDPSTGNPIPSTVQQLLATCYFKKVSPKIEEKTGADTSTFAIVGYSVEPVQLPQWCKNSRNSCPCWINGVGQGQFRWEPKIHVVKDLVESITGTQLQGTFVLEGGFNEINPQY